MSAIASTSSRIARPTTRERLVAPVVALLVAGALGAAAIGGIGPITGEPLLFAALLAALALAQWIEVPLVGSGHASPTTIPAVALAIVLGPAAVVLAEAAVALRLLAARKPPVRVLFDFGAMGLAGVAASVVASALPSTGNGLALTGLVAGAAYFAVNTVFLLAVWWLHEGRGPVRLYRERVSDTTPYELAYGAFAGLLVLGGQRLGLMVIALVGVPLIAMWAGQKHSLARSAASVADLEQANERLRQLMLQTVESLARTIEARDPHTGGHTERVGEFAQAIARRLGLSEDELRALAAGAVIHDIGKIGIPDAILLKDGPLDEHEWAWMRRHPEIGAYILGELDIPPVAKLVARHHHERYDGRGYPDGLRGDEIPLAARVLTVADALDAMTSDRPYRRAMSFSAALAELREKSGTQFCPAVVGALLAAHVAGELEVISTGTP